MNYEPLRNFLKTMTGIVERHNDAQEILALGEPALSDLIRDDSWLPESCATPDANSYRQYLLYCDPLERFSVVSFVWGPDQKTPVHDHTVWGLVGILRGAELETQYDIRNDRLEQIERRTLQAGTVAVLNPDDGDVHKVENAGAGVSISIHVYGANIGKTARSVFLAGDKVTRKNFVSSYHNATLPNIWN